MSLSNSFQGLVMLLTKKPIIELFFQLTSGSNEKLFFHVDKILFRIKEPFFIFWCSNAKGEDDSVG